MLNISASQTAQWNGQTVDATAVLLRYTFAGDANLDGIINGDDYFRIDAGYSAAASGYANGDFDYNGRIDADDFFLTDANYGKAQVVLPSLPPAGAELPRVLIRSLLASDETVRLVDGIVS